MNCGVTVERLYSQLENLIKKGYGKKFVLISQDDEVNGFHTAWDGACLLDDDVMQDVCHNPMYNAKNSIAIV